MPGLERYITTLLAVSLRGALGESEPSPLQEALDADDQCAVGDCSLSALQLKSHKLSNQEDESRLNSNSSMLYSLNWEARGHNFFNDFTFMTVDEMHGAAEFVSKEQAFAEGLAWADDGHAGIKVGARSATPMKRKSVNVHTNYAWDPNAGFLAVMKYRRLPVGPGMWPSFWTMNSDVLWPGGGELDILEYASDQRSAVTFHTDRACWLDKGRMDAFANAHFSGRENGMVRTNCRTNYFQNLLGCTPRQKGLTGQAHASTPGILAMEWNSQHIKVFKIPEGQIPQDLQHGSPNPDTWDQWVIAYFPFAPGCEGIAGPQELVLDIGLCGDWAGGFWGKSPMTQIPGYSTWNGCAVSIFDPERDCCTRFVSSPEADGLFRDHGAFDMEFMQVYTPAGHVFASSGGGGRTASGTFRRGGVPLQGL